MSNFSSYTTYIPTGIPEAQPTGGIQVNESSGVTAISVVNGQGVSDRSERSYQTSASELTGHAPGSWQATARGKGGHPSPVITPDVMVTIDGIQAKVSDMVKAQMLAVDSKGNYYRPTEFPSLREDEANQDISELNKHSNDIPAVMHPELISAVNDAIGDVPQQTLDTVTGLGIGVALGHLSMGSVIRDYANKSGKDVDESGQRVQFVMDAYQSQADNHLMKNCRLSQDDLPAFYEFARMPQNEAILRAAINGQVYGKKMNYWNSLADKFMGSVPPTPEAIIASKGYETRKDNMGETLVNVRGMWMTAKVAARCGFL